MELATKKQRNLMKKYQEKYGKDYLTEYLREAYPDAKMTILSKAEAQYIITGRKKHEKHLREMRKVNDAILGKKDD